MRASLIPRSCGALALLTLLACAPDAQGPDARAAEPDERPQEQAPADRAAAELAEILAGVSETSTLIFLTRHGEAEPPPYTDDPPNPPLASAGRARAAALGELLAGAGITRVLSTDLARTRGTAEPLAAALGLSIEVYDGRALEGFAATLREATGRIYVAGHSNTTPEVVSLLGGEAGPALDHRWEYDRLYVVELDGDAVRTSLLRYGEVSVPPADSAAEG